MLQQSLNNVYCTVLENRYGVFMAHFKLWNHFKSGMKFHGLIMGTSKHYHSLTLTMCLLDCDCLIISSAFLKGVGVRGVACSKEPDTRGVLATLKLITTVLVNIIKQSHKTLYRIDYCHWLVTKIVLFNLCVIQVLFPCGFKIYWLGNDKSYVVHRNMNCPMIKDKLRKDNEERGIEVKIHLT